MAKRGGQQQLAFMPPERGKRRSGKTKDGRARVSHEARPEVSGRQPLHVTLKVVPAVGRLRRRKVYQAVRRALQCSMGWSRWAGRFRICHLSLQGDHLHLIVEADDRTALSRGIQGFMISCAKQINSMLTGPDGAPRRGSVFADRYHARALSSPREVRNAIQYVLCNWRHHGFSRELPGVRLDPYASGETFGGWIDTPPLLRCREGSEWLMVWLPKTWLLKTGWQRHGPIDPWHTPG